MRSLSVVAADPRLGRAAEIQRLGELVGVRAGGRIDDGMGAADDLELVVVPRRLLGTFVRAVADLDRALVERIRRIVGVEDELDHLPVALVRVVEVVEGVEEPVLQRELPGRRPLRRHVRVDRGVGVLREPAGPLLVRAARVERVPREIEVVLVQPGEVCRRRADLHEVEGVPGAPEGDRRIAEERIDVHRLVGLSRPALLLLLDEADDRRELLRERRSSARSADCRRREGERDRRDDDACPGGPSVDEQAPRFRWFVSEREP